MMPNIATVLKEEIARVASKEGLPLCLLLWCLDLLPRESK